jgi:DNA polymerase
VSGCLSLDFETRSRADLKKVGAFRYANDPSTEIICAALSRDEGEPLIWVNSKFGQSDPGVDDLVKEWLYGDCLIYAHNAQFEQAIFEALCPRYFGFGNPWKMRPRWRCTAAMARKAALPSSLEKCAAVLGLKQQKDKRGGALIRKFCIPDPDTGEFVNPADHPEDFRALLDYCKQDVRTEQEIHQALKAFELTGLSLRTFLMDYVINARGLPVNVEALHRAHELVQQASDKLAPEFKEITGLNPTQATAFLSWLKERGYAADDLRAATLDEQLEELEITDGSAEVIRALGIRKMLSYSSVKKLPAMIACAGPRDNRVRGSLLYHGAERTGRLSGRLVQPQNFKSPPPHLKPYTHEMYRLIQQGTTVEEMDMHYGPAIECVGSCIRHFIHQPGEKLLNADYSAIEARIIAWWAGEKWREEVFRTHGMIYEASAAEMFGLTMQDFKDYKKKSGKHHPLRQKGKVAELACIAEGQLVLTDRGLVPIEEVSLSHRVWDGISFVNHGGVVYQGIKEAITYETLTATPDHVVWTERGQMQLGEAAASRSRLLRSGNGREALRVGGDSQPGEAIPEWVDHRVRQDEMHGMPEGVVAVSRKSSFREVEGLPALLAPTQDSALAGQESNCNEIAMHEPSGCGIPQLRWQGDRVSVSNSSVRVPMDSGESGLTPKHGVGQNPQRRTLRTGESSVCNQVNADEECTNVESGFPRRSVGEEREPLRLQYFDKAPADGTQPRGNCEERQGGREEQKEVLVQHQEASARVRTYDILNCGPLNRFTVSGILVHNCGFQGGVNALIAMGALKGGIKEEELPDIVARWRERSPNICNLWYQCDRAVRAAIGNPGSSHIVNGRATYTVQKAAGMRFLFCALPSGRRLAYPDPRIERSVTWKKDGKRQVILNPTEAQIREAQNDDPKAWVKDDVTYAGFPSGKAVWGRIVGSPGKWVENVVQAIAADIMCHGCLNAEEAGYQTATLIHDEWLGYKLPGQTAERLIELLTDLPPWADGLPIKAEGGEVPYYLKE